MAQRTLALSLALLALASCSDSEAKERLRTNARATWESTLEVAEEMRLQAIAGVEAGLAELEPRLKELQDYAAQKTGEARVTAEKLLADLEQERTAMRQLLHDLRTQGAQAVERMKAEAGAELDRLNERLDELLGKRAESEVP